MITGGDLRQSRLDVGYKTFTISPWLVNLIQFIWSARNASSPFLIAILYFDDSSSSSELSFGELQINFSLLFLITIEPQPVLITELASRACEYNLSITDPPSFPNQIFG